MGIFPCGEVGHPVECPDGLSDEVGIVGSVDDVEKFAAVLKMNVAGFDGVFVLFLLCQRAVTLEELDRTETEEKRQTSADFLQTIQYVELPDNKEAENLAWVYIVDNVMSQVRMEDLRHIAYAVVARSLPKNESAEISD